MKYSLTNFTVIGIILLTMTIVSIFSFRQEAQTNQKKEKDQDDPPTIIRLGEMNERQRKNSKMYNRSLEVPDLISENRDVLRGIGEPIVSEDLQDVTQSQEQYFKKITCQADTVIIGKVKNKFSQLSEDNKSVFTDYDFEISEVVKNTSSFSATPDKTIVVSRSGGIISLNNRKIEVINAAYNRLKIGRNYLLFLKYINDSESFAPSAVEGTFEIQNDKIKRLKNSPAPYQNSEEFLVPFLNSINSITEGCSQKEKYEQAYTIKIKEQEI